MIEGLWTVRFQTPIGAGGGAVVLIKGKVLGGDAGYTYIGVYEESGNTFKGKVSVSNYDPTLASVFGPLRNFELNIEGAIQGEKITGLGSVSGHSAPKLNVSLTRRAPLP